ncbi:MAG: hypothetical protein L3I91_01215 [Mycoplasma sp.]
MKANLSKQKEPLKTLEFKNTHSVFNYKSALNTLAEINAQNQHKKENNSKPMLILDFDADRSFLTKSIIEAKNLHLRKYQEDINLVFITSYSLTSAKEMIKNKLGINRAYIISNNGARSYCLHKDQFISEHTFNEEQKSFFQHAGAIGEFYTTASTLQTNLSYAPNYVLKQDFYQTTYDDIPLADSFVTYDNYIRFNKICSFLCYEKNVDRLKRNYNIIQNLASDWNVFVSSIVNDKFIVTPGGVNAANAILELLEKLGYKDLEKVYYFALTTFDKKIWSLNNTRRLINRSLWIKNEHYRTIKIKDEEMYDETKTVSTLNDFISNIIKIHHKQ